ncbi:MAG: hypothetical protein PVH61_27215 [Candidatus Aminicenantes bacterium]|jgi:hypothetical protein
MLAGSFNSKFFPFTETIIRGWVILLFIFLIVPYFSVHGVKLTESEKIISAYFEAIRGKPILLRQFLLEMPKGGDLHPKKPPTIIFLVSVPG